MYKTLSFWVTLHLNFFLNHQNILLQNLSTEFINQNHQNQNSEYTFFRIKEFKTNSFRKYPPNRKLMPRICQISEFVQNSQNSNSTRIQL